MPRTRTLTLSCSLSLTGDYATMGRQAHAALSLFAADQNQAGGVCINGAWYSLALDPHDDRSDTQECSAIYRSLCYEPRPENLLLLGPYSSRLTRVALPIAGERGMLLSGNLHESEREFGAERCGYRQTRTRMRVVVM